MIIGAAICPHPPMLVPEVAQGAAGDLDDLRSACDEAVQTLIDLRPEHIAVVGSGRTEQFWDHDAGGTLQPYGVDVHAGGEGSDLPLSLTIGAWLLDRANWRGSRAYATGEIAPRGRAALLVMADGSARRSTEAPGYFDERAEPFDRGVAEALATADSAALQNLDPELGEQLWAGGVPALKQLGRMIGAEQAKGASVTAHVHYDEAPFGVGYWVANWAVDWAVDKG